MRKPFFEGAPAPGALSERMPFAQNLDRIMRSRDVSQSELARRLRIRSQAVNQWLRGRTMPTGAKLEGIAAALDTSVPELMGGASAPSGASEPKGARLAEQIDVDRLTLVVEMLGAAFARDGLSVASDAQRFARTMVRVYDLLTAAISAHERSTAEKLARAILEQERDAREKIKDARNS